MSPANRALNARELQEYLVLARCFDPQRQRASQVVPLHERRLRTIVDRPIYVGPRPRPSRWRALWQDPAWRFVVLTIICTALLWLGASASGHSPEPFKP